MRVLVTGATGFVGGEIVRQLIDRGDGVLALVRSPESRLARDLAGRYPGIEFRRGDILEPASLTEAGSGVDAVIHLVGIISETRRGMFERVHAGGTRHVLEAARKAGVRRFIHMSALGTRAGAASRYHRSKWEGEESVRASGLEWTIFRPSLIFGPGDAFVNLFARMARWSPVLPVMGSGRAVFQPVAVEDVAACFVRALREPRSVGRTFDLCGPDTLTLKEILGEILGALGLRRWRCRIPLPVARVQAGLLEMVYPRVLRRAPPLNLDQLKMLEEDNRGDATPARELLGFQPRPFRAGIGRYLGTGQTSIP